MKRIILKKGEEERILRGHPWVYGNEVERILEGKGDAADAAELVAGELADVESVGRRYLGRALVNPASKILARLVGPSKEGVDVGFFKRRIRRAVERRLALGMDPRAVSCRLVFAEADFLPGLVIDCFAGWSFDDVQRAALPRPLDCSALEGALGPPEKVLSVQILTFAMEARIPLILQAMNETLPRFLGADAPPAVIEKVSRIMREKEKIPEREALRQGAIPPNGLVIFENGLPFVVDLEGGQKTGHYLDQRENRLFARRFAGKRTLDAFCYSGGFAIHAARGGAEETLAVDSSKSALDLVEKNALLNNVQDRIKTIQADVFDLLTGYERAKERFDAIILDPPSFASSMANLESAAAGYKEINLKALKMLNEGGVLITCSCSRAMTEARFKRMILEAAHDAERRLIQTDFRPQAGDHPILLGYDESFYLKCGVYTAV
ncbi:MAG: class I SAM-dependent rRNA methyltransferase [Spirochaetaceae bacterium]|jgi:23S rRNA (cytosine1962-C5)-methyltransferase|nr:class I SAM-dependent rRNA methyltransferase [Spirochaetaceae bacterium]